MNTDPDDIRRIARAARPSGKDDHDPEIRSALEALADHPELAAELDAEREWDRQITEEHHQLQPPAQLEDQLIAALRDARKGAPAENPKVVSGHFTRRAWIGAAAAAIAVTAGGVWWRSRLLPMKQLVNRLADESRQGVTLSLMSMQTDEVVDWLSANDAPRADSLPPALEALGRKGCHIYDIEGHQVSLECFLLPGMREIHLFTTPNSGLSGEPSPADGIRFQQEGELTAALWSQGRNTMVLVSEAAEQELRPVLQA